MDVKDFITETIVQIHAAIEESEKKTQGEIMVNNVMSGGGIQFDIAVTTKEDASSSAEAHGKMGLQVVGIGANGQATNSSSSEMVSRIKFTINPDFN